MGELMPKTPKKEDEPERILILCVDRDNDVGKKADIKTPIIGRRKNMDAAVKLILQDPEEADANAMFEAIRIYDNLKADKSSEDLYQIATIAGSELGGIAADRKLVSELRSVLKKFPADGIILVTDGFSDEDILPLIQSRVPVTSVRRVVVKHSESIEETAALFSRYLKMLVEDPRYSRTFLGLPGILLIIWAVLSFIGLFIPYDIGTWAGIAALFIVGVYLLTRGYRLDEKVLKLYKWLAMAYSLPDLVTRFSLFAGLIIIGIGLYQAWSYVAAQVIQYPLPTDVSYWLALLPKILGHLISKSLTMTVIGVCISIFGKIIRYLLERDVRFWRTIAMLIVCAWSWEIFYEVARILLNPEIPSDRLILSIMIGILIIVISGLGAHLLGKRYQHLFKG